ncbi:HAMP domain-containing sensor histidine kinase [Microlunatus lacustris]
MNLSADLDLRRTAWRIGIQTAALLMASLVVVGAVVYAAVISSQNNQMTQSLTAAAAVARAGGDPDRDHDRDTAGPSGVHTAVLADGQLRLSSQVPAGLPDVPAMKAVTRNGQEDQRTVVVASGRYRVLTVRRNDQVVQAMASLFEQHQERERILTALGLAGGAGVVMSTLLGAFLARRAVRPMADALALQRRFVADAGHELRTPLTLLSTRAQLLHRRLTADPAARHDNDAPTDMDLVTRDLTGILADTRALTGILEELLLAADTRSPLPTKSVDVAALAQTVVASAQAAAGDAHVSLDLTVTGNAVIDAGSPTALSRAITALIDNAVGHATSRVLVEVSRRGSCVVVEVTDDGPGIPEAVLPRMFARFASDRTSTAAAPAGRRHYGLGLSLVSEIAARHRGNVTARNRPEPASGAALRLELPRTAPPTSRRSRTKI